MYPHFLVIGAQKAGTTWLDRNLRTHPQIWLPPEKEIHFFDLPRPLPFAALQYAPDRSVRHWARHRLRRDLSKVERGEQSRQWYLRYYYALRTWRWYRSLFSPSTRQSCGEATPRYAVQPRWKIAAIRRRIPNLKIVYLLRDPIDRMWSDLAMFHDQRFGGDGTQTVGQSVNSAFLRKRNSLRHSRYAENLRRWEQCFGREQIFVGFMEDMAIQPSTLLRNIFEFLGVDGTHKPPTALTKQKINFADYPALPESVACRLASNLIDDTRQLNGLLDNSHPRDWIARMENLIKASPSGRTAEVA